MNGMFQSESAMPWEGMSQAEILADLRRIHNEMAEKREKDEEALRAALEGMGTPELVHLNREIFKILQKRDPLLNSRSGEAA